MSAPNCLRCLVRPAAARTATLASRTVGTPQTAPRTIAAAAAAPFSTTAAAAAKPRPQPMSAASKAGGGTKSHQRSGKRLQLGKFKKERAVDKGRTPLPGERKAYRKRIALSNDNAIDVPGLPDLGPADLADPANTARVMALPEAVQDQLRTSEAFKTTQCWGIFRKPSVLVRKETVDLAAQMHAAAADKKTLRLVVTGDKVAGKSMMLLQAMAHAYLNNWVVINIPEAQDLTTACTEYAPVPNSDPVQYMQPVYMLQLLQAIKRANEKVLASVSTVNDHPGLPQHITANTPLLTLVNAAKEPDAAWPVFRALWSELTAPGADRPPVLLALDGLAHAMQVSAYRSPAFELIHAHDLALLRVFTDALGGAVPLPGGGAVLAATSRSNAPRAPSMEHSLAAREAEQAGVPAPQKAPFFRGYDERAEAVLRSVRVLRVGGADKREARSLMEYWAASGMLRATVDEKVVTEKWALSGGGVLGEMERAALLTMRI